MADVSVTLLPGREYVELFIRSELNAEKSFRSPNHLDFCDDIEPGGTASIGDILSAWSESCWNL